jgi:hypothetical protein
LTFDSVGYELTFIQRRKIVDDTAHKSTFIYKFFSPVTQFHYIINVDEHEGNVFAVKFYCKRDRKLDDKYRRIVNKNDVANILITCLKVVPEILGTCSDASFCFMGMQSIDPVTNTLEPLENTQRFKIYTTVVQRLIGIETFEHFQYSNISGYLLLNKTHANTYNKQIEFIEMFKNTYPSFSDIFV